MLELSPPLMVCKKEQRNPHFFSKPEQQGEQSRLALARGNGPHACVFSASRLALYCRLVARRVKACRVWLRPRVADAAGDEELSAWGMLEAQQHVWKHCGLRLMCGEVRSLSGRAD